MTRGAKNLTSGFTGPEAAKASAQGRSPAVARRVRGLDPVQRLKARENAAGSENPTR
jgi:hypothetical protein